jgi:hypothetical protein
MTHLLESSDQFTNICFKIVEVLGSHEASIAVSTSGAISQAFLTKSLSLEQFRNILFELPDSIIDDSLRPEYFSMRAFGVLHDLYGLEFTSPLNPSELINGILDLASDIDAMFEESGGCSCLQDFCELLLKERIADRDCTKFLVSFGFRLSQLKEWLTSKH